MTQADSSTFETGLSVVTYDSRVEQELFAASWIMFSALPFEQDTVIYIGLVESDICSVCSLDSVLKERRQKDKEERLSLVVWRRPVTTLHYFLLETFVKLKEWTYK